MYESFYGLKEKPFTLLPDPEYLYLSPKHQRALTLLEYGMMNQAGFSVICGDTGAGKTTLIRRLLSELEDNTTVGLITNTHESFGELLSWVLMAFGLDGEGKSKSQMHQMFIAFLIEQYAQNKHSVLIVDEAQNMKADTLEELRMLSNINSDKDQVLQVILAGQPALRETLRKPELMQFAQRIAVDYYLEALSEEETKAYIQHRLHVAGSDTEIFTDDACRAIYKYSGGTPRLINLLSDTALVYGFAEQNKLIEAQLVHDVVREQHSNSIIPTFNTTQAHATDNMPPVQVEAAKPVEQPAVVETQASIAETPIEPVHEAPPIKKAETLAEKQLAQGEDRIMAGLAQRAVDAVHGADENPAATASAEVSADEKTAKPVNDVENTAPKQEEKSADIESQDDVAPYLTGRQQRDDDQYHPIVHIEEPAKKGVSGLLVGIVSGMFVASLMMMVFAWIVLNDKTEPASQAPDTSIEQTSKKEADRLILQAMQKERDAALAATRALEHERDAALVAAKAQEQMRAAELRAAEILAQQEKKAEAKLREAQARMRQAESAEAKARERERALKLKAQQLAEKQEAQRLEALKIERKKIEAQAQKRVESVRVKQRAVVAKPEQTPDIVSEKVVKKVETQDSKSFSSNPCNSPSAKFLSTCKR